MAGCRELNPTPTTPKLDRIDADQPISYRDIDPSYWIESPATRALDPHDSLIQPFRERKVGDLANPDAPLAFEGENRISREFRAPLTPWDPIESVLPFEWSTIEEIAPTRLADLRRAVRFRTVLRHPDFRIVEVGMAPHATLPLHALAEPSAFHVVTGQAEFDVENETIEAFVGTTIKLEPYETRAIRVTSEEPFRALWFRWAPGGDETYLDFGYYLTGTNFHVQPLEATFPADYEHWPESLRQKHRVVEATPRQVDVRPNERDFLAQQDQSLTQRREMNSDRVPLYPTAPRASDETRRVLAGSISRTTRPPVSSGQATPPARATISTDGMRSPA
jgi:quercetin dioxygenase-like cupin family protein